MNKQGNKKPVRAKSVTIEARQNASIAKIKEVALTCHTVTDACRKANVPYVTFEGWCKKRPKLNEEIKSLLKKSIAIRKQVTENGFTELIISYDAMRHSNRRFTDNEKQKMIDIICYAYEKGVTISSVCAELDLSESRFFKWVNPESVDSYPYAVERYAESKATRRVIMNETDIINARMTLQTKMTERKVTNTTLHYETRGVNGEQEILKGKTVHERTVEPDLSAMSLVLNNLDPDFNKKMLNQGAIDTEEFVNMTAEQLREEIEKERARKQLLDGGSDE